jgi:hypothetical protein
MRLGKRKPYSRHTSLRSTVDIANRHDMETYLREVRRLPSRKSARERRHAHLTTVQGPNAQLDEIECIGGVLTQKRNSIPTWTSCIGPLCNVRLAQVRSGYLRTLESGSTPRHPSQVGHILFHALILPLDKSSQIPQSLRPRIPDHRFNSLWH